MSAFIRRIISRFVKSERGSILVLAAAGIIGVMALTGLSVDIGRVMVERRDTQNSADAAALSGAAILLKTGSVSGAMSTATSWAAKNIPSAATTVNLPPTAGGYVGNNDCIRVRAEEDSGNFFTPGLASKTIAATATACIVRAPKDYGVIALNPTICSAMYYNGNASLTVNNGATLTNSSCAASAFYANGSAIAATGGHDVVGGWDISGNSSVSPTPTWSHPVTDPLAGLPVPAQPSSPVQTCPTFTPGGGTYNLSPGVYNCKIDPKNGNIVNFAPGDYYIRDGFNFNSSGAVTFGAGVYTLGPAGFKMNGSASLIGIGVTFYIKDGGTIDMNGSGTSVLKAPTSGTYRGVLFFQSRTNNLDIHLNGNAVADGWGAVYAPAALVDFNGNASSKFQIIADRFKMNGSSTLNITFENGIQTQVPSIKLLE